jgi:AraC-like DNA-binding protein
VCPGHAPQWRTWRWTVAASPQPAMPKPPTKKRTFTPSHRQRLDRAAMHYLQECYRKRTAARVSEFAELLNCHPDYLTRMAASILGSSLLEYLRKKQLEEAERLLLTTPLSNEQVALLAGFGTPSTFYRHFRASRNTSPRAFRMVRK